MSDAAAKRGLWISILLGAALGLIWGVPRYGAIHVSTWNLMGLCVIGTVSAFAVIALLVTIRAAKKNPPPETRG